METEFQKWPARPGVKYTRELGKLILKLAPSGGAQLSTLDIDFTKIPLDEILSDKNFELALDMIVDAMPHMDRGAKRKEIEALDLQAFVTHLIGAIQHNVVFIMDLLGLKPKSSGPSTMPLPNAPASESPSSTPSTGSPERT